MKKSFILLFCALQFSFSQMPMLNTKLVKKINSIIDTTDAVVGVAIKDLKSGENIFINENEIFPTASTIKIFILAEVFKQSAEGKFQMNEVRQLQKQHRVGGSGILDKLDEKSTALTIRDYCVLMMNISDNSATNFLIDLVGIKNINASIAKYGCINTKLQRVMMDTQAAKEGRENISTPKDFLTILEKLYNGEVVSKQASSEMLAIMKLEKESWLTAAIDKEITIADKAGDLDGVRCDVGIIFLENSPYIISIMTKYLSNAATGTALISQISKEVFTYFERKANSNQFGRRIAK